MSILQKYAKLVAPAALIVIALSVVSLYRSITADPFQEQMDLYYEIMALQVLRVAEGLPPDTPVGLIAFESELETTAIKRLLRRLKKAGLAIQHVEGLVETGDAQWDPHREGFPYREFLRVAETHPDLKAIISLCGTPYILKKNSLPDPASLPSLLVTGDVEFPRQLRRMLNDGRVTTALVPRKDPLPDPAKDAAQWLDRDFEMRYARSR